jgi:gliding motility-associated-like protein
MLTPYVIAAQSGMIAPKKSNICSNLSFSMKYRLTLLLLIIFISVQAIAQNPPSTSCGQKEIMQHFYAMHPEYKSINEQVEKQLALRNRAIQSGTLKTQRTTAVVTLPVVVHIIHNNGSENISDAQVFQGIQHLNEAFANSGYYDPSDGVNTQIQFCIAQRDPSNNATNGITRDVSTYTNMGGSAYYSDDLNVKDINRWNPLCYINIWLVKSIPGSVVGYAYLPSAHGSNVDGIIIEAGYFGSSYPNDVVVAHEMGHYLGLYHTFEGGCTNNDCTSDGDKVCDTPPDQSTAGISCTSTANSCTTDILSGFATDQNDLTQDYMDYGNFNCMKVFTQGQADRMNWFIQNVRSSLLACKSCMSPCPAPVTADFSSPALPFIAGSNYTFTNTSINAASYEWYVNGLLKSSSVNLNYTFPSIGSYTIKLVAKSSSPLCDDAVKTIIINAVCGVIASFTKSANTVAAGTNINFTNTASGADSYQWIVNGIPQSTATNFSYTSSTAGDYAIQLIAKNTIAGCQQTWTDTVHYTCSVIADFTQSTATAIVNTAVGFTSTSTGATVFQWLVNAVPAGSGPTLSNTFTAAGVYSIQLIAGNGVCNATKYGTVYITDKCGNAQYQFQKYYAAGINSGAQDIRSTPDGGSVLAERVISNGGNVNGSILKLDAAGNSQWMHVYGYNRTTLFKKIKTTTDGGYIAIGNIESPGTQGSVQTYIVKTDATGVVIWTRVIVIAAVFSNFGSDIIQSADGNYYFTGTIEQPEVTGSSDVMAGKIDGSGNLLWLVACDARSSETGNGIAEDNTHLIICGNKSGQAAGSGFLLQLNKSNGSTVWAQTYLSTDENFLDVQVLPAGYYVNALRRVALGGLYTDHVYLKTDFTGKLNYARYIQPFGTSELTQWASSVVKPNGNIISQTSADFNGTYVDFIIQEINPATGIVWSKKYNKPNSWQSSLTIAADNGLWLGGISLQPTAPALQTYVMKLDSMGNSGSCPSVPVQPALFTAAYSTGIADFTSKQIDAQISRDDSERIITVVTNSVCQYIKCDSITPPPDTCKLCDTLRLAGTDTVCSFANAVTYSITRSPGCPALPYWKLSDDSYGIISIVNDSTVTIAFQKTGPVTLYASIKTGCKILKDSINLTVFNAPHSINLGPDIQLCSFSTLKLNAGAGFASYLWNDGSADSILTAYNPGQYFVTATDYCGNQYRDTINLSQAPVVPFDLGPDVQKCNNDTVTIAAPGNFSTYTWSANYNISSIKAATVKVWPAKDTTYTVVAQVAIGCTVVDTIRITMKQSPPLNIGNDTSFCAGNKLVLQAPNGFNNYVWQDGSSGNTFTASQAGLYWLHAIAANGCISRDSISIKNVYPLPVNFIATGADICDGKNLELTALGSWPVYRWFNNSSSASVTINAAGHYWLQVTSADGCSATDTIVVSSKDCVNGIWFPNVFTPDNNGKNDTWKPVVHGIPQNFRLSIYNRLGEKVFETTDFRKGWDGLYKGKQQPPDTFVWYCIYQFAGAAAKMEKGPLILVR